MLRILSDLHLRDASTRVQRIEDLAPLLEGVDELWLNGDTCDNQSGMTPAELDDVRRYFTSRVSKVRFITGNHDPDISDCHEATTADGQVWATHGDVFLDSIVPWSRVRDQLEQRLRDSLAADPSLDFTAFEGRIIAMRRACVGFGRECDPERKDTAHRLRRLVTEFFPPRQPAAMLNTWWTFPDRVVAAASIYGVRLFGDGSPAHLLGQVAGELYFACAETDVYAPAETVDALEAHLASLDVAARVERYPGTEHGFAFPLRPVFDKAAAERHWERLFALFGRNLHRVD